jgi:hypothetical protein
VVSSLFVLYQHHPPEGTRAKGLHSVKVIQLGCVLRGGEVGGQSGRPPAFLWPTVLGSGAHPVPPAEGPWGAGGGRWVKAGNEVVQGHSYRRVAAARSGPGLGPRSCWQVCVSGGWGPPDGRVWWGRRFGGKGIKCNHGHRENQWGLPQSPQVDLFIYLETGSQMWPRLAWNS